MLDFTWVDQALYFLMLKSFIKLAPIVPHNALVAVAARPEIKRALTKVAVGLLLLWMLLRTLKHIDDQLSSWTNYQLFASLTLMFRWL